MWSRKVAWVEAGDARGPFLLQNMDPEQETFLQDDPVTRCTEDV